MKRVLRGFLLCVLGLYAGGCVTMQDQFSVKADGSATWKYKIVLGPQMTAMLKQAKAESATEGVSLDGSDDGPYFEKEQLEAAVKAVPGVKVQAFTSKEENNTTVISALIQVDAIDKLAGSELGRRIGWSFKKEGSELVAYAAPLLGGDENSMFGGPGQDPEEQFGMAKGMLHGMRINRRLELPGPPTGGNSQGARGNVVAWDFRMDSDTVAAQFKAASELKLETRCAATGIVFKLPLELAPAMGEADEAPPVTAEDLKGATAIAEMASLTRTREYTKNSWSHFGQGLELRCKIQWPRNLRPTSYTGPYLTAATDDLGTDLRPKEQSFQKPGDLKSIHSFGSSSETSIELNLAEPAASAKHFSVSAYVILQTPGKIRPITVTNLASLKGQRIPNLPTGVQVVLKEANGNSVTLEIASAGGERIGEIDALGAGGVKLRERGTSFSSSNKETVKTFDYNAPPASLIIHVAEEITPLKVPIEFKNLALP